jgi:hypothetical protein
MVEISRQNMTKKIKNLIWLLPYNWRKSAFKILYREKSKRYRIKLKGEDVNGTSFTGFVKHSTIFVHIPKAAGLSVNRSLFGNNGGGHIPLRNYQFIFDKDKFNSYFKFSIVRNPWDRLYSAYSFLNNGGLTDNDKIFAAKYVTGYADFDSFVKGSVNQVNIMKGIHLIPQYLFLTDSNGNLLTDYVGKFENLNEEYKLITEKLNIVSKLKKTNKSRRGTDYKDFYTAESKAIVAEVYKKDIELFNYSF